jgi:hypothetical protein
MKIRVVGSKDIVRSFCDKAEQLLGVSPGIYPSRYGANEVRAYLDVDDRMAAEILGVSPGAPLIQKAEL